MADDKKIKLGFETEYKGDGAEAAKDGVKSVGEQAKKSARDLGKLGDEKGLESIRDGASEADAGLLELLERLRKTKDRAEELTERAEELEDGLENTGDKAGGMAEDLKKIKRVQLATSMGELAGELAKVGGQVKKAGGDMRVFDEDTGRLLETIGGGAEDIAGFVEAGLKGFAAGGPLGAAVGLMKQSFSQIADSIEDAAKVSKIVSSQITTDWKLNKTAVDAVKKSVDEYRDAIKQLNGAHDEELRKLRAKNSLQQQLREIQLELSGRESEADILRLQNSDLSETEKRERIAEIRLEQLRAKQEAERKALDEEIQNKEAALKTLEDRELKAEERLKQAKSGAEFFSPDKAENAERTLENLLRRQAEEAAGLSGSVVRGVGFGGSLAGSRGNFGGVAEDLKEGEFSKVRAGDLADKDVRGNLTGIAQSVLEGVAKDRERFTGARDSVLNDLETRAKSLIKITELIEKLEAAATQKAAAAKTAAEQLKAAQEELENASGDRDAQDDGLRSDIEASKAKRDALPRVQDKELDARSEDLQIRVKEAEQAAENAQKTAADAGDATKKITGDIDKVSEKTAAATKDITGAAEKGIAAADGLGNAAEKVGDVAKTVDDSGRKLGESMRRVESSVTKSTTSQIAINNQFSRKIESLTRQLAIQEETIRSLS